MNNLEAIRDKYKPYRLTKKKNITILESTSGTYVVKEKNNDNIKKAYNYLISRNFDYFPELKEANRSDYNIFEYIDGVSMPREQKAIDMIDLVALLHNKTTYFKEITEDKYKEIYENLENNINYELNYYDNMYNMLIEEVYPSPSHYLMLRNIYKIFEALDYCKNELDEWYAKIKEDLKIRVSFIHNNLELDHFIKNNKPYLVSWEKSKIDTPILDLLTFYQKEYMNLNFEVILKRYMHNYPLSNEELKLFFIVISIPPIINLEGEERHVTQEARKRLDYIFKTENLVKALTNDEGTLDK